MATLEDKILGEKLHNYCSSSEESDNEESWTKKAPLEESNSPLENSKWEGTSTNTGPKGVIEDWRKFKQLETEKREENERDLIELAKKLTMTVRTVNDEMTEEDRELAELFSDDEFLVEYRKRRIEEMMKQTNSKKKMFGNLFHLDSSQAFLDAIDNEDPSVSILVHIYDASLHSCQTLNQALIRLAEIHSHVKFAAVQASSVGVSSRFRLVGVPAILIYRGGHIIGNFVGLTRELGEHVSVEDLQGFLVEHGLLEDKSLEPELIRRGVNREDEDE